MQPIAPRASARPPMPPEFMSDMVVLFEQLETRLVEKMELHQTSLLEAMNGVDHQVKKGMAQVKELVVEERAAGDEANLSETPGNLRDSPKQTSQQSIGSDGNEAVWSEDVDEAMPAVASGGSAGSQEAAHPATPRAKKSAKGAAPKKGQSWRAKELTNLSNIKKQLTSDKLSIKTQSRKHLDDASWRTKAWATKLANNWIFEMLVALTIVSNAVSIGLDSDQTIKNPGSSRPLVFIVLDWTFLSIFVFELALRMYSEGRDFFRYTAKMFGWNVFDTMVVTLTLLNDIHILPVHLSVVRVFRVVRLVYVVRVIRLMAGFKELRMMIDGIMKCGKTLLWSSLVMFGLTYVYAVVCLQFSAEWLAASEGAASGPSEGTVVFLDENFPSLLYSIYTLFKAVTGGVSWGEVSDPLQDVSPILIFTFPLFIIVTVFCVLNIVTAAFVEAAARKSQEDESAALEHIAHRTQWIKDIQDIFKRHDTDSTGFIEFEEFGDIMTDWRTRSALQAIGVDMTFQQATTLFKCFDCDGDGHIDINEFAQGLHHLTGTARSLDVFRQFMRLSRQVSALSRKLKPIASRGNSPRGTLRGKLSQEPDGPLSEGA